ncbi:MAG: glycoside hydrolase family 3 N-terminal domain-containing protein [Spirochaetota bacterium]
MAELKIGGLHRLVGMPTEVLYQMVRAFSESAKVPLLFSGDMEFNSFSKINDGSEFPGPLNVAATGEPANARKMGLIAALEGSALGFNWNFGPVVDIIRHHHSAIVSTRAYSDDTETIIRFAEEYVQAMQENGMIACAKHWPGDGVDYRDQHLVTSCNALDMATWRATYGKIYKALIEAGIKTVMSAHITLPACDREVQPNISAENILPGSINKHLNIKLLREELGFNGLIISDATPMAGLRSMGKEADILPLVIENGCDMYLFANDNREEFDLLLRSAQSGKISEARLEESVLRVLGLKASIKLHQKEYPSIDTVKRTLDSAERKTWGKQVADDSITLVKDTQNLLPLDRQKHRRILLIESQPLSVFGAEAAHLEFASLLESEGFTILRMEAGTVVDPVLFDAVIYLLDQKEFFGFGSFRMQWGPLHGGGPLQGMARYWHEIPTLMISVNNPFHLYDAPRVKTYINAYSSLPIVQQALVEKLLGRSPFKGRSPFDPYCGLEEASL